ncbi:MAG TPA: D-2-hydroxyacid dehydrogenase [Hyphomicrobiaceae bacterium]|nr:D-2-hydroxyacid dehydrogenase [Hyphomicrobiaceae bacterium]
MSSPVPPLPAKDQLTIGFAHAAYQMADRFQARNTGIRHFQVRALDDLRTRAAEADVIVVSMMWRNDLLASCPKLRFVQSISAGVDQYDKDAFRSAGVRLASAAGVNANAVAEHAIALMLALDRQLPMARDNQAKKFWRPMAATIAAREAELAGRTLVIVGLGRIGERVARLARAFDMHVIGVKRNPSTGSEGCHEVVATSDLERVLPKADVVVLACPLTAETENLIGARALALLKPTAHLVNVARGKVVDEAALAAALSSGALKAAALDVTREEPLAEASPLWAMPNVFITPHTGGETQAYEDNVIDILMENLDRLWRGEARLRNEIV